MNKFSFNFCLHWSGGITEGQAVVGGGGGGVGRESPFAREVRGDKVKKHKLPVLLKLFQSLLTSPEFVQNLKASSSLIMGCPLAKETALSCIQIRYKRMHRWTKRKTIPTSTLKTDTKLLAINIQYQLIQNSLDWISDFRMTSLTCTCASYVFS